MAYIADLVQDRIMKLAKAQLVNHPVLIDRLCTEFETGSQATRFMTSMISPFEWPHTAKSDWDFHNVDKRLLKYLDQWVSSQPEILSPLQPIPLNPPPLSIPTPPAGAPPAEKAAGVDQVQVTVPKIPGVIVHSIKHEPKNAMAARIIEAMNATGSSATSIVFVALREGAALRGDEPFTGVIQQDEGHTKAPLGSLQFKDLHNKDQWLTPPKLKDRIRNLKIAKQME